MCPRPGNLAANVETEHMWLIGLTGVGKTSVGRRAARLAGAPFFDTDAEVSRITNLSVAEFWEANGEEAFRRLEAEAVRSAAHLRTPSVIATGGGAILDGGSRTLMTETGLVVWLVAELPWLARRLETRKRRPVLDGDIRSRLELLMEQRAEFYESTADVVVDVTHHSKNDVAKAVLNHWVSGAVG